jgi:hypothetical protein
MKKTCHDDPWPRKSINQIIEHSDSDKSLIDYIITNIESQGDPATQILQVNAILLGIYVGLATSVINISANKK